MPASERLRAYMITCHERAAVCRDTIARYGATDLCDVPLRVFYDSEAIEARGLLVENKTLRQELVARRALETALRDRAPYILFLEDDLEFNLHIHENLTRWRPVVSGALMLGSLYNPGVIGRGYVEVDHYFAAAPETVYGSQAFLLARPCVEYILYHWQEEVPAQDIKFSRLAARLGKPLYYYHPSLVQHVGVQSTWNGVMHTGMNFDKDFRLPRTAQPAPTLAARFVPFMLSSMKGIRPRSRPGPRSGTGC